ncbi:hypothetical protein BSB46_17515 [Salmonella enterica]|nr:hypothetical protein [Salmonella enterica]
MTALNKQALRVPERKIHNWNKAVMRDCEFCSQWSLTVKHEDGGCICASCCDAEYTSELKGALESEIDRAEAAERRIAELEARDINIKRQAQALFEAIANPNDCYIPAYVRCLREALNGNSTGIGVKGE